MLNLCSAEPYDSLSSWWMHSEASLIPSFSLNCWLFFGSFNPPIFWATVIFRQAMFTAEKLSTIITPERHVSFGIALLAFHLFGTLFNFPLCAYAFGDAAKVMFCVLNVFPCIQWFFRRVFGNFNTA